ncbi:MAG: hypothetical protein ACLPZJ_01610, partial [Terriglobales bacterium]
MPERIQKPWRATKFHNHINQEINMETVTGSAPAAIVLVHGGFVDGSGWEDVYKILRKDGYNVSIVQNATVTLADDVVATRK